MQSEWYYVIGAVAGFLPVSMGLLYLLSVLRSPSVNYNGKHVRKECAFRILFEATFYAGPYNWR